MKRHPPKGTFEKKGGNDEPVDLLSQAWLSCVREGESVAFAKGRSV